MKTILSSLAGVLLAISAHADTCNDDYFEMARENSWRISGLLEHARLQVEALNKERREVTPLRDTLDADLLARQLDKENPVFELIFSTSQRGYTVCRDLLLDIDQLQARYRRQSTLSYQQWEPALRDCERQNNEALYNIAARFSNGMSPMETDMEIMMLERNGLADLRESCEADRVYLEDVEKRRKAAPQK